MLYKVLKGRINGKEVGEVVELDEKTGKAYGEEYVEAVGENDLQKEKTEETKQVKGAKNKALTPNETVTKND